MAERQSRGGGDRVVTAWEIFALQGLENSRNAEGISILRELAARAGGTCCADEQGATRGPRPPTIRAADRSRGSSAASIAIAIHSGGAASARARRKFSALQSLEN